MLQPAGIDGIVTGSEFQRAGAARFAGLDHTASLSERVLFVGVCAYILSQAFMIPVMTIGPSWAAWPTIADFVVGGLVVTLVASGRVTLSKWDRRYGLWLMLVVVLIAWIVLAMDRYLVSLYDPQVSASMATYYVYRLLAFIVVFISVSQITLTDERRRLLARSALLAFLFASVSVYLTFFGVVSLARLVSHLPADLRISGPWTFFYLVSPRGWGTISFNHGYVALTILMLMALTLHLRPRDAGIWRVLIVSFATGAIILTESRAGLAAALVFGGLYLLRSLGIARTAVIVLAVVVAFWTIPDVLATRLPLDRIDYLLQRQSRIFDPLAAESLSGRDRIWQQYWDELGSNPRMLLFGNGLGSTGSRESPNAHMLYLQIIVETGLVGLAVFFGIAIITLRALWRYEGDAQPILLVTIALLVSALSQETFYPVPAFGHFLGFFLLAVALAIGKPASGLPEKRPLVAAGSAYWPVR